MGTNRMKSKKRFSDEFKKEALKLAKDIGVRKAAIELDINESTIRTWRFKQNTLTQEDKKEPTESNQPKVKKTNSELEKEVRKLSKEIEYLKQINNVLKKSHAIFSTEHLENLK